MKTYTIKVMGSGTAMEISKDLIALGKEIAENVEINGEPTNEFISEIYPVLGYEITEDSK
jgi:hypothetical protein